MFHFCTYFDRNYLLRGLTLYRSLKATGCAFQLHVLALDNETAEILGKLALPDVSCVALSELEEWAPELLVAKCNRRLIEYYFTLTPQLPLLIFARNPDIDLITYLDADLYFYASPQPLFTELGERSILITPHRYPPHLMDHERYGRFNVQYQSFRRTSSGLACLERWRTQCLDWCYDRAEDGKYGDQKYLDEWPDLYGEELAVLNHKGGGLAPWNWSSHPITPTAHGMEINGEPLIFYHFHGVKVFNPYFISNGLLDWGVMPRKQLRWFYANYLREMRRTRDWITFRIGTALPMRDKNIRGTGIKLSSFGEIIRKAWAQTTLAI